MKKGGLADSPFFTKPQPVEVPSVQPIATDPAPNTKSSAPQASKAKRKKALSTSNHATMTPRYRDTKLDTTIPRHHATIIEVVRKAVKEFGKEAATHRFTLEEKKAIADILYAYKGRGIKTSENEIARIAINYLISDYRENGENSVLHKVIEALNT